MPHNNSANYNPLVSREQVGNAIGDALRLFVGRGRRYSVKQLSNGTGIKDRVIECAMCREGTVDYRPLPQEALVSITCFLGAAFANEWLGLANLTASDTDSVNHDDLATAAIDYVGEHARARHPESECGVDIGPNEDKALNAKRARLVA